MSLTRHNIAVKVMDNVFATIGDFGMVQNGVTLVNHS
jgi:hypothetical protein